jgi:uncharacterized protein DUF11
MWCRTQKPLAAVAIAVACACCAALGDEGLTFYRGPVVVRKVSGTIDLQSNEPAAAPLKVWIDHTSRLTNEVKIAFHGSNPVSITRDLDSTQPLTLSPSRVDPSDWESDPNGLRKAHLNLVLEIDGALLNEPIDEVDVLILLPAGVPALIRSSMPLEMGNAQPAAYKRPTPGRRTRYRKAPRAKLAQPGTLPEPVTVEDRVAYRLVLQRSYLTELNLIYNAPPARTPPARTPPAPTPPAPTPPAPTPPAPTPAVVSVSLAIKKSISPTSITAGSVVKITLQICNRGPDAASQVVLSDNFDPRDFNQLFPAPIGALGSFDNWVGSPNDRLLMWTYTAASVPLCTSGQLTVPYYLNANYKVSHCTLNAVTATIAGKLVGVSNKIRIP